MPRIIPFEKCVARPESSLIEHLLSVKQYMENFFKDYDTVTSSLSGLAGVCHDIAKAHADWQAYIQSPLIKKGPNHSACGAFLFSFLGFHFLKGNNLWDQYKIHWLWFIQDIQNHHGRLGDVHNDNWLKKYEWDRFDLKGIEIFLKNQYEELNGINLQQSTLTQWINDGRYLLEDLYDELDLEYEDWEPLPIMQKLQVWRQMTTSLIAGDRFHVKEVHTHWLEKEDFKIFNKSINEFSQKHAKEPLSIIRIKAQEDIIHQLTKVPNQSFYTLEMPTGYGKTITALKMASWFGEHQQFKKIIYVAPYLSILEQNAVVIKKLFHTEVLQHHSLALLDEDSNQRVSFSQLAMESWAHSLVCTSFQQFCKAIFPNRAQDVLRRAFLKDSIIIIDEPQIFNPEIWNLFLCGLEALTSLIHLKVIFLSATMPPFHYGLSKQPMKLSVSGSKQHNRFHVVMENEKQSELTIGELLEKNERKTQALILNTVKDAFLSFQSLVEQGKKGYLLHGLMTPVHKRALINKISQQLKKDRENPLYVVSTQVLEAGVDLSFQHVARALSTLPSIVQTAGRTNRHMENNEKGLVTVFPFYRNGNIDTRSMIYPRNLQKITDQILKVKQIYEESEMVDLVNKYYSEMFRQNTYEAALMKIKDAYEGRWQQLSDVQPFNNQYIRLPIFVPFEPDDNDIIDKQVLNLKERFQVSRPEQIYEKYSDWNFMSEMSFEERKMFMILFNYYVLNVPVKTALSLVSKEDYLQKRIPILLDSEAYDGIYGLKAGMEEDDPIW